MEGKEREKVRLREGRVAGGGGGRDGEKVEVLFLWLKWRKEIVYYFCDSN